MPVGSKVRNDLRLGKTGIVQSPVEIPLPRGGPGGLGVAQKINAARGRCCQGRDRLSSGRVVTECYRIGLPDRKSPFLLVSRAEVIEEEIASIRIKDKN